MDWRQGAFDRTRIVPGPSTTPSSKRWVTHARHDGPSPHQAVGHRAPGGSGGGAGAGGAFAVGSSSSPKMVALDGSRGEGGGQILRTALTLSLLTGRAFRMNRVRAGRSRPGLRPQHLKAVEAAARLCGAEVAGGSVGSTDLTFRPGPLDLRDLRVDIGTAGATALVLQALHLPIALRSEGGVRVTLVGGTFNTSAPSFPFLDTTWRRHLAAIGFPVTLAMPAAGYYPEGGGQLDAWIEPAMPRALVLEDRGALVKVWGVAETTNLPTGIAHRMRRTAASGLLARGIDAEIDAVNRPGPGNGASIALVAEFERGAPATFVGLGERGKPAERVAEEAVGELLAHLETPGGAVDLHSADQLLLPLAFAEGRSVYTVTGATEHLRTNIATIHAFLDRPIRIEDLDGGGARVIVG